jgi:drug/metabolite transporter (DMT)-like permease
MTFWTIVASIAGGAAAMLLFGLQWPAAEDWPLFAASGVMVGFGRFLIIRAFRLAAAAVVSPLKYLALVWGALIGYLVWGDVPGFLDVAGATVVVASGIYLATIGGRRG